MHLACERIIRPMKILRIYVDTSVIGGCFDPEFSPWSNGLMEDFKRGALAPVLSEVVALEVLPAPDFVQAKYAELLALSQEFLEVSREALELLGAYASTESCHPASGTICCTSPWRQSPMLMCCQLEFQTYRKAGQDPHLQWHQLVPRLQASTNLFSPRGHELWKGMRSTPSKW